MDCPPIPQFCLSFLLKLLDRVPPSASIANRDFLLSSKPEYYGEAGLQVKHYKVQIMLLHSGLH